MGKSEPSFWDRTKAVGGGTLKVAFGGLTVVGSGIGEVTSLGSLTPLMVATTAFGVNTASSGAVDIYNATFGDFDKVGEINPIKDSLQFATEKGTDLVTDNEQLISIATDSMGVIVDGADLITGAFGVAGGFDKIFNKSSKLVTVATNTMSKVKNAFGNATFKVPKVSNMAKAVATGDVMFTLNSMYENSSDKVKKFLENLFYRR